MIFGIIFSLLALISIFFDIPHLSRVPETKYVTQEALGQPKDLKYYIHTEIRSKGSIIAGEKFHVDVKIKAIRDNLKFKQSGKNRIKIGETCYHYPLKKEEGHYAGSFIELSMENDKTLTGEEDLICSLPGKNKLYEFGIITTNRGEEAIPESSKKIVIQPQKTNVFINQNRLSLALTLAVIGLSTISLSKTLFN